MNWNYYFDANEIYIEKKTEEFYMASMSITPFHLYMTCDVYNLFFMPLLHQKQERKESSTS